MANTKISADQIALGNKTLETSKIVFQDDDLVSFNALTLVPYDSWDLVIPGVLPGNHRHWVTLAVPSSLRITKIGGVCGFGTCNVQLMFTDNMETFTNVGGSLDLTTSMNSEVRDFDIDKFNIWKRGAICVDLMGSGKDLTFFVWVTRK